MLSADYDESGTPDGMWTAFTEAGYVNKRGPGFECTELGWRLYEPGMGDVDWDVLDNNVRNHATFLVPSPWPGGGLYSAGTRLRSLEQAEIRGLLASGKSDHFRATIEASLDK